MAYSSFYSILYVELHPSSGERLNIALMLSDGKKAFFDYNPERISLLSQLIGNKKAAFIRDFIHYSDARFESSHGLFLNDEVKSDWSKDQLFYLSRYSTNIIRYTAPIDIDLECDERTLEMLVASSFGKGKSAMVNQSEVSFASKAKMRIHKGLDKRVTFDAKVDTSMLPTLLSPTKISAIGKNDAPFICEFVDLSKRIDFCSHKIAHLTALDYALMDKFKRPSTNFILSDEPSKADDEAHQLWQNLYKSTRFNVVPLDEFDRVKEYAEEHNVQPLVL